MKNRGRGRGGLIVCEMANEKSYAGLGASRMGKHSVGKAPFKKANEKSEAGLAIKN